MADISTNMDNSTINNGSNDPSINPNSIHSNNNINHNISHNGSMKPDNTGSLPNPNQTVTVVENASELALGPEFDDIQILSNAQVAVYLQANAKSAVNRDEELHEVYRKTLKYVDRFNSMTNPSKENQELIDELDNLQEYVTLSFSFYLFFFQFIFILFFYFFSFFLYLLSSQCSNNLSKRNR